MSRKLALAYTQSLPDFVCTQLIHRFIDVSHRGFWRPVDTLTVKLSYLEKQEDHKLELVNGTPTGKSFADLVGAVTVGEFGLILQQIFEQSTQAVFTWQKWTKAGKRPAAIYLYRVEEPHSRYLLNFAAAKGLTRARVGYHGMVEMDRGTGDVLRLTYIADSIPKDYPIRSSTTTVTYDFADVGSTLYLLPASSETEMRSNEMWAKNHSDFREYRKFSADSTIRFGDGK
jgi:hypothetical protein